MKLIVYDTETTFFKKGNPHSRCNRACYLGFYDGANYTILDLDRDAFWQDKAETLLTGVNLLIGFNLKFDLQWLKRLDAYIEPDKVWDCQLVHFILSNQKDRFPDLNGVSSHNGLGSKLDNIDANYWSRGVDTPDIPVHEITEYLKQDLLLTYQNYQKQLETLMTDPLKARLCSLHNQDLLCLMDMEDSGLRFNEQGTAKRVEEIDTRLKDIDSLLSAGLSGIPINFDSPDHLSAYLYGGPIRWDIREPYLFSYKNGKKSPVWKEKTVTKEVILPQQVKPLENSKLKKEGLWSADEDTLKQLKGRKKVLEILMERAKLSTLTGTFLAKFPKIQEEMDWPRGHLYGQYNQCVVITGRLSSSKPNQQNQPSEAKQFLETRYV